MKTQIVTALSLRGMLETREDVQHVVGRALVAIFRRQTKTEQVVNETNTENNIGFAGCDARSGCITAKYYLKHKTLLEWQVAMWTKPGKNGFPRLCKYARQLNEIAEEKSVKTLQIPAKKMCGCEFGDGEPVECVRPCRSHEIAKANGGLLSLHEHAAKESGLEGVALTHYINRYYGHG